MKNILFYIIFIIPIYSFSQEICNNGIDDDGDGLVDFNDVLDCQCAGFASTQQVPSLIPNSSFEDNSCCPNGYSQLNCADGWIQASGPTSDYWHSCGQSFGPGSPGPYPDGNGIAGFIDMGGYKEYIGACLLSPMQAGNTYLLDFYLGFTNVSIPIDITFYGTTTCADLPFGTGCPVGQGSWMQLGSITSNGPTWQNLQITFTPTVDINALVIGPPCADNGATLNYYYLDGLTLAETSAFATITIDETGGYCTNDKLLSAQTDTSGGVWQWYHNDVALVGENGPTLALSANNLPPDNYSVSYTVGIKCEKLDIQVLPPNFPTADFSTDSVCETFSTTFADASVHNSTALTSWQWDFTTDGVIDNNTQNPSNIYSSDGLFNATLTVTNNEGCSHDTTKPVLIDPMPNVNFGWLDVCEDNTMSFNDLTTINSGSIADWNWDFGDGTGTSFAEDTTYDYSLPGQYNVTLTVVSDSGCTDNRTQQVEVWINPTANFTFNDACDQTAIQFTNTSLGNGGTISSYQWDFTNDNAVDDIGSNAIHTYPSPDDYDVSLVVVTDDGCTDTIVQSIEIFANPVVGFTGQNVCEDSTISFTNNSNISTGTALTYQWDFANGNTSTADAPSETYTTEGIYNVTLTATSVDNCVSQISNPIEIYPTPQPQFITSNVCDGNTVNFTDFSNVSNQYTTNNITNWEWDFGDNVGTANGQFTNYLYSTDDTYTVEVEVTTNNACVATTSQTVTVYPNPVISFTSPNPDGCTELCSNFNNTSVINTGTIDSYLWNFGDGNASTDISPFNCITNNSLVDHQYTVTLTGTSNFGCQTTLTSPNFITVYPLPVADFEPSRYETNIYQTNIEFLNTSLLGDTYLWDFANLNTSIEESPLYIFPDNDEGVYNVCLETTTIHGCVADTCKEIIVIGSSNINVPNTFTPNGDGVNEMFTPSIFGVSDREFSFMIFDRWGLLIYTSTNPDYTIWDGTYKGQPSQIDTYVWKMNALDKYTNESIQLNGHINLLR